MFYPTKTDQKRRLWPVEPSARDREALQDHLPDDESPSVQQDGHEEDLERVPRVYLLPAVQQCQNQVCADGVYWPEQKSETGFQEEQQVDSHRKKIILAFLFPSAAWGYLA